MVSVEEIEKNDFNLNLPRYIDSQTPEDRQDIEAHLKGGIPESDIDALQKYWAVCPALRAALFNPGSAGFQPACGQDGRAPDHAPDHAPERASDDDLNPFTELDKINKASVAARLKEIKNDKEAKDEAAALNAWLKLNTEEADLKKRVKELAERYETPLPRMASRVTELEAKVNRHLEKMGFSWT